MAIGARPSTKPSLPPRLVSAAAPNSEGRHAVDERVVTADGGQGNATEIGNTLERAGDEELAIRRLNDGVGSFVALPAGARRRDVTAIDARHPRGEHVVAGTAGGAESGTAERNVTAEPAGHDDVARKA